MLVSFRLIEGPGIGLGRRVVRWSGKVGQTTVPVANVSIKVGH
jgi:hypothetical protein